jgi:hypothetical protein
MQQHSGPQTRILGLTEGYSATFGGDDVEGSGLAHGQYVARALNAWPGHWFVVGHRLRGGARRGFGSSNARRNGYECKEVNGKVYARVPHPDGVPLEQLVTKRRPWDVGDALPELKADKFGWSRGELNEAMATARAWLFPTEGIAA